MGTAGGQGYTWTSVYMEDLLSPKPTLMAGERDDGTFFAAFDSTLTCGWNQDEQQKPYPLIRTDVYRVEFLTNKANGAPVVSVTASFGKRQMKPEDVEACLAKGDGILPITKSYRMDFLFDGHDYKPAPSSADTVRLFRERG
jgi:hypothetical protein